MSVKIEFDDFIEEEEVDEDYYEKMSKFNDFAITTFTNCAIRYDEEPKQIIFPLSDRFEVVIKKK